MEYYLMAFQKFTDFNGRSRRKEFWMFTLINFVVSLVITILPGNFFSGVYYLVIFIPQLAIAFRRLHDVNKSGIYILVSLIPIVGWIWFLILMATDSDKSSNDYGPCPK